MMSPVSSSEFERMWLCGRSVCTITFGLRGSETSTAVKFFGALSCASHRMRRPSLATWIAMPSPMPPKPASVSWASSLKFQLAVPALGGAEGRDTGLAAVFFAGRLADVLAASLAGLRAGLRAEFLAVFLAGFLVGFLAIRVSVAWVRVKALPDRASKKIPLPVLRERGVGRRIGARQLEARAFSMKSGRSALLQSGMAL